MSTTIPAGYRFSVSSSNDINDENRVIYYIYDADELEVCNGNVTFSEQGEASVYVGTLDEGIYTIYIVVDVDVYGGEFQL